MKRKNELHRMLVPLAASLFPLISWAGPVSEAEARQKALTFLQERRPQAPATLQTVMGSRRAGMPSSEAGHGRCYVFNVGTGEGFVIVSGDDRTAAILGYADSGSLSDGSMPDGLRWLLDGYEEQIAWLDETGAHQAYTGDEAHSRVARASARTAIAPLTETTWNQGSPYNTYCPVKTDDTQTVTGCVATCMAQLMYYHQWPKGTTAAIPGYSTRNKLFTLDGLDATTFSWDDMLLTYGGTATDVQKAAVAELMQYCGYALQMNYDSTSSAFNQSIAESLKLYFGYSSDVDFVRRHAYSYTGWIELLYNELASGRPVALGGQSAGGGHSFICDGYQGDDYFHMNWGWGGMSNGYFRLTALNPQEQGLGGSSTLDGFSYDQEAVIGIHPAATGEDAAVTWLVLEGLQFEDSDVTTSKTFTRESSSDDFTDIPLYLIMECMTYGTTSFEIGAQVRDISGNAVQTIPLETSELAFSKAYDFTNTIAFGSGLSDGTYYINIVSRAGGSETWQPSYGSSVLYLTAVIAGNQLTVSTPCIVMGDAPTIEGITATDAESGSSALTLGEEVSVVATVRGGAGDYHGDLLLYVNGKKVMGKQADVPAGETVSVRFTYTPSTAGDNTIAIYAGNTEYNASKQIGSIKASVTDDGRTMALTLGLDVSISNTYTSGGDTFYYGKGIRATITATNSSTDYIYKGQVNCSVRTWDGDSFTGNATSYYVTIPKAADSETPGSIDIPVVIDGLEVGGTYNLRITYYTVEDGMKKLATNELNTDKLVMGPGYALGDAEGSRTLCDVSAYASIDCAEACFADLTGIPDFGGLTITASSNPNCLYFLASDAETPSALSGKNVVKGAEAASIALSDGHDFYSPVDIAAGSISYTRTFTRAATATGGWNTMMLPFTVGKVTVADGSTEVRWFTSGSDTGKDFWLMTMTGDDAGTVYFDHAGTITANTPYIIALPGEDFGDHQLTGKALVFSAEDAEVSATVKGSFGADEFKFCGSTVAQTLSDVFMLNTKGDKFIRATSATSLPPFRAWIEPADISSLSRQQLVIATGDSQGVDDVQVSRSEATATYNLAGQETANPQSRPGLYIRNGKKIIIK